MVGLLLYFSYLWSTQDAFCLLFGPRPPWGPRTFHTNINGEIVDENGNLVFVDKSGNIVDENANFSTDEDTNSSTNEYGNSSTNI